MTAMRNNNGAIIRQLAKRNGQANRGRNRILAGAAAFAVLMLTAVFGLALGKIEADRLLYTRSLGTAAYTVLERSTPRQKETIDSLPYIRSTGERVTVGETEDFFCRVLDAEAWEVMQAPAYTDIGGRYPREKEEVMLPVRALQSMGITDWQEGMEIPLEITLEEGGGVYRANFRLSGWYTEYVDPVNGRPDGYFSREFLDSLKQKAQIADQHTELLIQQRDSITEEDIEELLYGDVEMRDESQQFFGGNSMTWQAVYKMTGGFDTAALLAVVILAAAWLLIRNIMSISMTRDIRQYGLLKTLGATGGQLAWIIALETARSAVWGCVTGGIVGGLVSVMVLPRLLSGMYLYGLGSISAASVFHPWLLGISILFVLLVAIAGAMPAWIRVIRMTPVEAAGYVGAGKKVSPSIRLGRRFRSRSLLRRMALRNLLRQPGRMAVAVLSLALGITVSLAAVVITTGMDRTHEIDSEHSDFSILSYASSMEAGNFPADTEFFPDSLKEQILGLEGISESKVEEGAFGKISAGEEVLREFVSETESQAEVLPVTIHAVDEDFLRQLDGFAREKGLTVDVDAVRGGAGALLLHQDLLSPALTKQGNRRIGEDFPVTDLEGKGSGNLVFAGYLNGSQKGFPKLDLAWNSPRMVYLLVSREGLERLGLPRQTFRVELNVERKTEPVLKVTLNQLLDAYNRQFEEENGRQVIPMLDPRTVTLTAKSDLLAQETGYISSSRMVMGVLCAVLAVMGLVNYTNVTLTGLTVRRRELAVLESVGMTEKQGRKMLLWEGAFCWAAIALPVLAAGSALLYFAGRWMKERAAWFVFRYPLPEMTLCLALLAALCMSIPLLVCRRMRKESGGQ